MEILKKKNIILICLVFTYLAGSFSINIFNYNLEVRILGIIITVLSILIPIKTRKMKEKNQIPLNMLYFLFLIGCFYILTLLTFYFSDFQVIAINTLKEITILTILILLSVISVSKYKNLLDFYNSISKLFIFIGYVYSLPVYITVLSGSLRGNSIGGPNVATRIMFFGVASALFKYKSNRKPFYLISSIIFFVALILNGSRGGFLGAVFLFVFYLFFNFKKIINIVKNTLNLKSGLVLLIVLIIFVPVSNNVIQSFYVRFIETTFQNGEIYTSGRNVLYQQAFNLIRTSPILGTGLGSFYFYTNWEYPHNILLELMIDFGIMGLIAFIIIFTISILVLYKNKKSLFFPMIYLPLYMIIVQMFSGTYYDFRYFFLWIIPILFFKRINLFNKKID